MQLQVCMLKMVLSMPWLFHLQAVVALVFFHDQGGCFQPGKIKTTKAKHMYTIHTGEAN